MTCRPETRALSAVEKYVVTNAGNLTPRDVKDLLVAFASIESPPQALMVNAAILQLPSKFGDTTASDLSQLLTVRFFAASEWFKALCGMHLQAMYF